MKYFSEILIFLLSVVLLACTQKYVKGNSQEKSLVEIKLNDALKDSTGHNCIDNKRVIIANEETAINVVEPILFGIYGKDNITKQRPYKADLMRDYWIIEGSMPKDQLGGTFLIILDSRNGEILKITHGK